MKFKIRIIYPIAFFVLEFFYRTSATGKQLAPGVPFIVEILTDIFSMEYKLSNPEVNTFCKRCTSCKQANNGQTYSPVGTNV